MTPFAEGTIEARTGEYFHTCDISALAKSKEKGVNSPANQPSRKLALSCITVPSADVSLLASGGLWTCHNLSQVEASINRAVPVFLKSKTRPGVFELAGCVQILGCQPCEAGSDELRRYLEGRYGTSGAKALARSKWARVAVKRVVDPLLVPYLPAADDWTPLKHANAVRWALTLRPMMKANDPQV